MDTLARIPVFLLAMVATLLPHRLWGRLPASYPVEPAAFASGLATFLLGAAVGIPGFFEHVGATVSLANKSMLESGFYNRGFASGFSALSIFTFLLLTPTGWLTLYLFGSGGLRMGGAWFDDPMGDPLLTLIDDRMFRQRQTQRVRHERATREALEGPDIPDRVVTSVKAGIPGCDLVIVSARRKEGWAQGVVVYTAEACYRIGEPVERTIAGNLRTLYPLTEHKDLEAVRKSVHYELPR